MTHQTWSETYLKILCNWHTMKSNLTWCPNSSHKMPHTFPTKIKNLCIPHCFFTPWIHCLHMNLTHTTTMSSRDSLHWIQKHNVLWILETCMWEIFTCNYNIRMCHQSFSLGPSIPCIAASTIDPIMINPKQNAVN